MIIMIIMILKMILVIMIINVEDDPGVQDLDDEDDSFAGKGWLCSVKLKQTFNFLGKDFAIFNTAT